MLIPLGAFLAVLFLILEIHTEGSPQAPYFTFGAICSLLLCLLGLALTLREVPA